MNLSNVNAFLITLLYDVRENGRVMSIGVPAVQNRFNAFYVENPEKVAKSIKNKTLAFNVLEKITMVFMATIMAGVLAISFGIGASITGLPIILFSGVLLTPLLSIAVSKLHAKVAELKGKRDLAIAISDTHKEISNWTDQQIQAELQQAGIQLGPVQMGALGQLNPQRPLQALLPVLSRYLLWKELQIKNHQEAATDFVYVPAPEDAAMGQLLITQALREGWSRLEKGELPAAFFAAHALKVILDPTYQPKSPAEIGTFHVCEPEARLLAREFGRPADIYYSFNDPNRAPLRFDQVQTNHTALSPVRLMNLIYV